ncbi:MAG TPA: phosphatidylglycerophosphatase A [Candidatus Limnocylindrales bacterium]|nr:phosphatidylglycerophosphatase A [Candidatus Limnocylindrales bacterium]
MTIFPVKRFRGRLLWRAVASGLGIGFAPAAPGTFGSLLALPLWYWGGGAGIVHIGALVLVLLLSIPAARVEILETGRKDPPSVVIDEVAGMLLAATGIPWGWKPAVLLFLLFRFFDILKFGPAAWANEREGAVYVVADDLAAGVYANLAYRGIVWLTG